MIVCDKCGKTVMYVTLLWFSNFIDGLLLAADSSSSSSNVVVVVCLFVIKLKNAC